MKRWVKSIILDWLHSESEETNKITCHKEIDDSELNHEQAWYFKIFPAIGGRIIEIRKYDDQKGQSVNARYIITDDKDFNTSLGKIISMEFLKN